MRRPIARYVWGYSFPTAVQSGIVRGADADGRGIQRVEACREGWGRRIRVRSNFVLGLVLRGAAACAGTALLGGRWTRRRRKCFLLSLFFFFRVGVGNQSHYQGNVWVLMLKQAFSSLQTTWSCKPDLGLFRQSVPPLMAQYMSGLSACAIKNSRFKKQQV